MSETTPRFDLPLIAAGQAQKHVPVNEALGKLDALIQLSVLGRTSTVPGAPLAGHRYIVGLGAGGVWTGQGGRIASFDGGWQFLTPREGWLCWDAGTEELLVYNDGSWRVFSAGEGGGSGSGDLQNIPLLGLGAEADETNPFTAKLNSALWTAREIADGGTGDLRYVMNKEAGSNVLSLLFQSDFGGRAEMGLIGDEDFLFKVSADGTIWHEALRIDRTSGRARFPQGGVRELLAGNRTYYVRTDGSDANDGLANTSARAFQSIQKAVDVALGTLDFGGFAVTIQIADGTYTAPTQIGPGVGLTAASRLTIQGNAASPGNVVISTTAATCFLAVNGGICFVRDVELRTATSGYCLRSESDSHIEFANVRFGPCAQSHMLALSEGRVIATGAYTVTGGAAYHKQSAGGYIRTNMQSVVLTGSPAFSQSYAFADRNGVVDCANMTFSGSATGVRYLAALGGGVFVAGNGVNYLPGGTAGVATSPGWYG